MFTMNNPTPQELEKIHGLKELCVPVSTEEREGAMRLCKEHWTGGGTKHIHVVIFFCKQQTLTPAWKTKYGLTRADVEKLKSPKAAWNYVYKNPPYEAHKPEWEEGVDPDYSVGDYAPAQGKRSDLDGAVEDIQAGASIREVARAHPVQFIKFNRGLHSLVQMMSEPRRLDMMPRCFVMFGGTGTGKSARAWGLSGTFPTGMYAKSAALGNWWDMYQGEEAVFLDEFRGQMTITDFLQLVDVYPWISQNKGGTVNHRGSTFIFASPVNPLEWWDWTGKEGKQFQLERRLTENPDSRIYSTDLKCFTDYKGDALDPQPEWPAWLESCKERV